MAVDIEWPLATLQPLEVDVVSVGPGGSAVSVFSRASASPVCQTIVQQTVTVIETATVRSRRRDIARA
jgi:hypothetical protein